LGVTHFTQRHHITQITHHAPQETKNLLFSYTSKTRGKQMREMRDFPAFRKIGAL